MFKQLATEAFRNPESKAFARTNDFLAFLTLLSIAGIVLETVEGLQEHAFLFKFIEVWTVIFFSLEYIARIYEAPNRRQYIFSFFGIIDLLSILPTFLQLKNLTFLKAARTLRIMRFLRLVRLAKIARLPKRHLDTEHQSHLYLINIQIYFFALLSAVISFGTLIYLVEGTYDDFANIPLGMLWAFKIIMGGVPNVAANTLGGEIVLVLTRFIGLILLGLLIHVVGSIVTTLLFGSKDALKTSHENKSETV